MSGFSIKEVISYFEPGGPVEKSVPGFIYRDEQVRLAGNIAQVLTDSEILVSEVGTGVGKTLAYLVPAFLWASREKKQVVISTRTKALQQQIVDRDIPGLLAASGLKLSCEEAKGRENYLCWNKYRSILAGKISLDDGEQQFMNYVVSWAGKTETGDKRELNIVGELMQHWKIIAADRRTCARENCRYQDKCFRLKMIKRLKKADIIVVNHALLLSDLQVNNAILPEYQYLIVDEAHNFDRESFDKLSCRFSYQETSDVLKAIYFQDKKYARGYLQHLKKSFPNLKDELNEISELVNRSLDILNVLFDILDQLRRNGENEYSSVIREEDMERPWFINFYDTGGDWETCTRLLLKRLYRLKEELAETDEEGELASFIQVVHECLEQAYGVLEEDLNRQDSICWVEFSGGKAKTLSSSRIMIGEILNQTLYKRLESLVMVSATLAVESKFDFFLEKNGLNLVDVQERVKTLMESSPFDYEHQAGLFTVKDMPDPNSPIYPDETARVLMDIVSVMNGGILVLFTSRRQLHMVSRILKPLCHSSGIKLLVQDENAASGNMLQEFAESGNAVLLGLETFWEGVDVKGDALRGVVIVRLPFRAPGDPFCVAGDKFSRMQGKDSFWNFMLPDAAMRFKQGTGRLIRCETDRGIVVVLDSRLEKSRYGRVFKNSIPIKNYRAVDKSEIVRNINSFLNLKHKV